MSSGESRDNNPPTEQEQPPLAIEFPRNEIRQPRQPSNLQDLLRYAVEAGSQGNTNERQVAPLDPERSSFLYNALNNLMVNVSEEFRKLIAVLREHQDDEDMCVEALDTLGEHVCSIDYANDFLKMHGNEVIELCLDSKYDEVRWRSAELIADIVQNNPFGQQFILQAKLLEKLLIMIEADSSEQVRVKCLYAISCLIRENDQCLSEFLRQDGLSVLLRCLQSDVTKLIIKTCFLVSSLCSTSLDVKNNLFMMGVVEQLCALITIENCQKETNEHLLSALSTLIEDYPDAQDQCRQSQLNLKYKLTTMKQKHGCDPAFDHQVEYIDTIYNTVFGSSGDDMGAEDNEDR